ncbi:hypothetical protein A3C96_00955 [Candidatus Uhrbacteria bacterium RIFCSPHIGHO2_02_FULL_60_10]|uniref:Uncharacterized protein n=1 Tax=Candidatus Uhrbacteria bacterium RIFCSPHIGHO2_02_FULL_60_10 TaxID=1802392 RepID=A0A1F7U3V7_9BACT|nr:MAG: hypothetical protein A3C96_00955 [Candidatus Uhrbacteria bacterium RIFCSPHIGHO2_02_FULL_60_10]
MPRQYGIARLPPRRGAHRAGAMRTGDMGRPGSAETFNILSGPSLPGIVLAYIPGKQKTAETAERRSSDAVVRICGRLRRGRRGRGLGRVGHWDSGHLTTADAKTAGGGLIQDGPGPLEVRQGGFDR